MLFFRSDQEMIDRAARIAASDIRANFMPYQAGLLEEEKVCIMAGIDYDTPWTRDTAINTCFALAVTDPEIARNTLLAVCERNEDGTVFTTTYTKDGASDVVIKVDTKLSQAEVDGKIIPLVDCVEGGITE